MTRYIIKNNLKLMFRNTWSILIMLIGPVLVITILSSAFSELMKSYEGVDEFEVGYRMEEGRKYSGLFTVVKSYGEEEGIIFIEYSEGEVRDIMEKNNLAGFVDFSDDTYTIYKSANYQVEGMSLEYFINKITDSMEDMAAGSAQIEDITLPKQELEFMPAVNSVDYYGIIYIVYFCWCGLICATGVLGSEKKYKIARRFQVSGVSEFKNYIGKFIPVTLTVAVGMAFVTAMTIALYDIHWGVPLLSVLIVFMTILAGNALGMMVYNISDNLAITVIVLFTVVWLMGFFGGSFETYMFSDFPDAVKQLSPIYHTNRALVELSCMGKSDYTVSAVGYSFIIMAVCSAAAVFAGYIRKRGRA